MMGRNNTKKLKKASRGIRSTDPEEDSRLRFRDLSRWM
jgi:hypothetical protein